MKTPKVTPAQVLALVAAIIGVLVAFGVKISEEESAALLILTSVVSGFLINADKGIRVARNANPALRRVKTVREFPPPGIEFADDPDDMVGPSDCCGLDPMGPVR